MFQLLQRPCFQVIIYLSFLRHITHSNEQIFPSSPSLLSYTYTTDFFFISPSILILIHTTYPLSAHFLFNPASRTPALFPLHTTSQSPYPSSLSLPPRRTRLPFLLPTLSQMSTLISHPISPPSVFLPTSSNSTSQPSPLRTHSIRLLSSYSPLSIYLVSQLPPFHSPHFIPQPPPPTLFP